MQILILMLCAALFAGALLAGGGLWLLERVSPPGTGAGKWVARLFVLLAGFALPLALGLLAFAGSEALRRSAGNAPGGREEQAPTSTAVTSSPGAAPTQPITPPAATAAQTPGPSMRPADAPQGKIVYTCQVFRDSRRDQICIINADGTGQRRLTTDDQADYNFPSLAPDGQSVLFTGKEGLTFEIFEMDLESGVARQLTQDLGESSAPAVSPDGERIVFAVKAEGETAIWVMNRDGSDPRQVFGPPEGSGWDPVWSPDGERILFASNLGGPIQLYTIAAAGGDLQPVSRLDGIRGRSDWSPDGRLIATYAGEAWLREIFVMDPQGGALQQVTDGGNNLAPSFSPDGGWIAFTSYRDNYRNDNGCEIYVMRLDGSQVTRLTSNTYCDWQPRWGP